MDFDFPNLQQRTHLEPSFNPSNQAHVARYLNTLLQTPPTDFRSAHNWFKLFHEGSVAISDLQIRLELALHLDTSSQEAETQIRFFEKKILSQLLTARGALMQIYMDSPWKASMHPDDHGRIMADFEAKKLLSKADISALQLEENQLIREYKRYINESQTTWQGRNVPLPVVVGRLSDSNETTRSQAFSTYWDFIHNNEEILQDYFTKLLHNRKTQAKTLGLESYIPLAFAEFGRLDYTPSDCIALHRAIESKIIPALALLEEAQKKSLGATSIKPWNGTFWPKMVPSTHPAGSNLIALVEGMGRIAQDIHPSFGSAFALFVEKNLIHIHPTSNKAPGAFCVTLHESGLPVIFANMSGNYKDAITLAHEFGHALHGYATASIPNILLRTPGMEFCEFAATGLEVLASPHFKHWWPNPHEAQQARKNQIFSMLSFMPFMAMVDAWQHIIYTHDEGENPVFRNRVWRDLSKRFRPGLDWSEHPHLEGLGWFSRPHIFSSPFYYVDYGIAHLGAFQLWQQMQSNPKQALEGYIRGISLGAQRSLPELFKASGLKLDFSEENLQRLGDDVAAYLLEEEAG